ncbi:MAG: hypothetical protein E7040_08915 [Lentisphaerae bacterium]|nr:hypothetical protein [Lentisphaerota bacterium]
MQKLGVTNLTNKKSRYILYDSCPEECSGRISESKHGIYKPPTIKEKSMNPWIQKCAAVVLAAGALTLSFAVKAEEKVQKITFIEDDAQKNMASKIYYLKYTKAGDVAPFIRSAVVRYCKESNVSSINDPSRNRQMLLVSTGINMIPYVDKLVAVLDRNAKFDKYSNITGDGIAVGVYQPTYRAAESMLDVMVKGDVASGRQDGEIKFDSKRNMFYFKDTPATVADIKDKLAWLDKPVPQSRLELTIYELRDSDLQDIGIDYLAWKNGPGLNLFEVGYNALYVRVAEKIVDSLVNYGSELLGSTSLGFGGFYTAPAFDMSFIRILQQNGKATISSTASVVVSNVPGKDFAVTFAPEYQNIEKNADHKTSVTVGGDSTLTAIFYNAVITAGKNGTVNFNYELENRNVVERNNMGAELSEIEFISAAASLPFNKDVVLSSWTRTAEVEQTIGVPFLCELPVLKYIFGTTTKNKETIRCIAVVRAVPVVYNENMKPGTVADFDEISKK